MILTKLLILFPYFNIKCDLTKKDILTIIKKVEYSCYYKNTNATNELREIMVKNIEKFYNTKQQFSKTDKDFSKKLAVTYRFLDNHKIIFFTPADNGSLTVCLNTHDYKMKMKDLLNDRNIYKNIKRNALKSLQTKVHKILSYFNLNGYLQKQYQNNNLTQTNTQLPKAYGLPKIHKLDIPLRPIISTVNSLIHFLAIILNNELKNCIKKPISHINNSFVLKVVLKEKLADLTITSDCILVSLDASQTYRMGCQEI